MNLAKAFTLTIGALLLTGCYTQLQYTKTPDDRSEREQVTPSGGQGGEFLGEEYWDAFDIIEDNYISSWSYYNRYRIYDSLYDYEPAFGPYYSWFQATYMNPLYRWNYNIRWGTGFYSRYHSPFYYGYYWQGNNHHYFYIAGDNSIFYDSNVGNDSRHGLRSIGNSRNQDVGDYNRSIRNSGQSAVAQSSSLMINRPSRSASIAFKETRKRETVNGNSSESRSRSRGTDSRSKSDNQESGVTNGTITTTYLNRSENISKQASGSTTDLEKYIIPNSRIQKVEQSQKNNFFGRVKNFIENSSVGKSEKYLDRTGKGFVKSRGIGSSVKNKNRSTVSKSNNKSRTRSKASSGRSSSSSSVEKKRSRGGN